MKVRIEMIVEVSKENAEAWDVESHVKDALTMYEGNEIEFWDCNIESCRPALNEFPKNTCEVECIEGFTATHTNSICGEIVKEQRCFVKGVSYIVESWRPEGARVSGLFVFHRDASKFTILP